MMARSSWLAVISRKVSSSAPAASYAIAASTGSPASRRLTKLMPLDPPVLDVEAGDDADFEHDALPLPEIGRSAYMPVTLSREHDLCPKTGSHFSASCSRVQLRGAQCQAERLHSTPRTCSARPPFSASSRTSS